MKKYYRRCGGIAYKRGWRLTARIQMYTCMATGGWWVVGGGSITLRAAEAYGKCMEGLAG